MDGLNIEAGVPLAGEDVGLGDAVLHRLYGLSVGNYQFVGRKPLLSRYLTGAWVATPSLPGTKVQLFTMAVVTYVEIREIFRDQMLFFENPPSPLPLKGLHLSL